MAAAGDTYNVGPTSTASGAFLALQPGGANEVVIHNIYFGGAVELYFYDGSNQILFDSDGTSGARLDLRLHCTNTKYVRVKSTASTIYIAADGMYTK